MSELSRVSCKHCPSGCSCENHATHIVQYTVGPDQTVHEVPVCGECLNEISYMPVIQSSPGGFSEHDSPPRWRPVPVQDMNFVEIDEAASRLGKTAAEIRDLVRQHHLPFVGDDKPEQVDYDQLTGVLALPLFG